MQPIPLFIVRPDAKVEDLGFWHHERRTLELHRAGYPFLGPGEHVIEGELPWLFWDMAPSGYMGARFARRYPELGLPERTQLWSAGQVLTALSERGEDLPGNILVGHESSRRYAAFAQTMRAGALAANDLDELLTALQHELEVTVSAPGGSSSVGGERPKLLVRGVSTSGAFNDIIVKFSPRIGTELGARWRNLLAMEALCGAALEKHGVDACVAQSATVNQRGVLLSARFDRTHAAGRVGAGTLQWLAAERDVAALDAAKVCEGLAKDGLISQPDAATADRVHAFSAAIGNTDAHLGNYGLTFDEQGKASLAPIYDVLPMVFAPRFDELPDPHIKSRPNPIREDIEPWVATLVALARESDQLDPAFLELWLRYVGA